MGFIVTRTSLIWVLKTDYNFIIKITKNLLYFTINISNMDNIYIKGYYDD